MPRPANRREDFHKAAREVRILLNLLLNGLSERDFSAAHPFGWPPGHHAAYVVKHPHRQPGTAMAEFRQRVLARDFPGVKPRRAYRPGRPKKAAPWPEDPSKSLNRIRSIFDAAGLGARDEEDPYA